ncbi:hypothetical protein Tco_0894031, partial [Tanacetum coccineum]
LGLPVGSTFLLLGSLTLLPPLPTRPPVPSPRSAAAGRPALRVITLGGIFHTGENMGNVRERASESMIPKKILLEFLVPEAEAIFRHENGFKVLKLHLSSKNFLDAEELKLIQSPPNELEHIQLKVIDICGLSVYEAVVDVVLCCYCPRSLKLTVMFQTIYAEERNQVVKNGISGQKDNNYTVIAEGGDNGVAKKVKAINGNGSGSKVGLIEID